MPTVKKLPAKKKPSLLLPVTAAIALAAGGGTAYWFLNLRVAPGDLPIGAEVVPQNALMAIAISTDAPQWQKLREFGTKQSQTAFDQNLAQVRDRLLTANGLDYDKDIQPWIGKEVTVAFLSAQAAPSPGATPPPATPALPDPSPSATPPPATPALPDQQATLVVLPIQNPLQAKALLEKDRPQAGKLTQRTYKGFEIRETQGNPAQPFSATVLDGKFLVVTTDPKATDRAIDTYKGEASLASTPGYTQAVSKIRTNQSFGKLYVNLPAAAAVTSANSGKPISPQNLAQIQQTQGLAATMNLEADGVRFRSVSWLKPDSQKKYEVQNTAKTMPDRLPADTLIMASGGNLQKFWQDYADGASANPISPINPEALRTGLKSNLGMDLDQDFLAWMKGEFSLSLVAAPAGGAPGLPFGVVVMVQASDRRAGETAFSKLNQAMTEKYQVKVEEAKVGNQTVTNWTLPLAAISVTHGWMDGDVAFLTMGAPLVNGLLPKPTATLADSPAFKQAVPAEPNPNNGHFFINVERAASPQGLPLLPLTPANRDLVTAVRSLGVTAAISDDRSIRYDIFVALQKTGTPAAFPSPQMPAASPSPAVPGLPSPPAAAPSPSPQ